MRLGKGFRLKCLGCPSSRTKSTVSSSALFFTVPTMYLSLSVNLRALDAPYLSWTCGASCLPQNDPPQAVRTPHRHRLASTIY
ncbi:hypothetical protein DL93DRAFT_919203 [Clavulina sp. PMI_390]|nr:hypothetical protein DL93DRAFT_919203 [Clavulina sp. PMI_390]